MIGIIHATLEHFCVTFFTIATIQNISATRDFAEIVVANTNEVNKCYLFVQQFSEHKYF